ncbi:Uncharacterized protein D0Z07_5898 [Hyphodiscus hymeniophilus]|uniref:Uncharacterized protein n=1 Tax=Hyphodiscus hymeniophilus TaxID=353542 RepID=A0A9P6VH23_9HELO|nr:Uncharacterized protein D0Z07_5898 [Hyphodiscus hymeniophilus]
MKLTIFSILAFATVALAVQMPLKSVIVSYPDDTPDSVVDKAMDAVKAAGGMVCARLSISHNLLGFRITHEYKLIKGFAAKAPAKVLETVQTWGNDYHAIIEEDQMVTAVGGSTSK